MTRILLALLLILPFGSKAADSPWFAAGLIGQYDDSRFIDIFRANGGYLESSYLGAAIVGRELDVWWDHVVWEAEGHLVRHWGDQSHWEKNIALVVAWTHFPWDDWVDTRVSFAQGMSRASERPPVEEDTRHLLHYMHADITIRPPGSSRWSLVTRVYHRSGVFGLYGTSGGSNYLTTGLRYQF